LSADEAAAFLKRSPRTLEKWRRNGYGPRFSRVGRGVVYRKHVLLAWLEENEGSSTADFERYSPGAR